MSNAPQPSISEQKDKLKRRRFLATLIIVGAVAAFLIFSNYGLWTRVRLERKKSQLTESMGEMQHLQDSLRQRIRILQSDTTEVERIAREQYGMIKPGEQTFIMKRESKSPQ